MKKVIVVLCVSLCVLSLKATRRGEWVGCCFSAEPVKEKGLIAYWSFDEGKGEVVKDVSGNGCNGDLVDAEWTKSGKIGGALSFEEGTYVEVESEKLALKEAITIEAWVYPVDLGNYRDIVRREKEYLLRIDSPAEGNRFSFFPNLDGSWEPRVQLPTAPEVDKWYHVVAVWDGKKSQIWVNGKMGGEKERVGSPSGAGSTTTIGKEWVGKIDEVKIYNRALTESEIKAHYESVTKK